MSPSSPGPTHYEIRVREPLDLQWADWFDELAIRPTFLPDGTPITTLTGPIQDQSALSGILRQLNDINLSLISVNPIDDEEHPS